MGKKRGRPAGSGKGSGYYSKASKASRATAKQGKALVQAAGQVAQLPLNTARKVLNVMAAAASHGGASTTIQVQRAKMLPHALPVPRTRKFNFGQGRPNTITPQREAAQAVRNKQNSMFALLHKAGQRLQQKTKGITGRRNLGPMGEFPDTLVLEIAASGALHGRDVPHELSKDELQAQIRATIINPLIKYGTDLINVYAPKDTGDLRRAMIRKLEEGELTIRGFPQRPIQMFLGTPGVPYAKPVNKMPNAWLQHFGNKWSRASRSYLYDPFAMEGWFTMCLRDIQQKAESLWKQFMYYGYLQPKFELLRKAGFFSDTLAEIKKLFKVKFSPARRW